MEAVSCFQLADNTVMAWRSAVLERSRARELPKINRQLNAERLGFLHVIIEETIAGVGGSGIPPVSVAQRVVKPRPSASSVHLRQLSSSVVAWSLARIIYLTRPNSRDLTQKWLFKFAHPFSILFLRPIYPPKPRAFGWNFIL